MQKPAAYPDLMRGLVAALLVALLLIGCFLVLRPFLPGMLWGAMIVVASWPLMTRLEHATNGRRVLAATIMTSGLVLVVVVPLVLAVVTLVDNGGELIVWIGSLRQGALATPPAWIVDLPYVGPRIAQEWQRMLASSGNFGTSLSAHSREITGWIFAQAGSFGTVLLHFTLTVCVAALLYLHGEKAALYLRRLAIRLAGTRADALVTLAGQSIRAVALGIVVTALVQSLFGAIGLVITGVPFVGVLTSLMLMLCIAQVGPLFVLAPAVIWLFWQGHTWQGIVLAVFMTIAVTFDNVLRPLLIRRGANLPLLLILVGVVGGLIAFGLMGLFIGPVILALGYTLINAWIDDRIPASLPDPATPASEIIITEENSQG